ncbi:phosphotransferase enzyme family protein [Sinorhizobium fredii]|uniref:Aminoglycoside phosphotransferase protein n=1 Tax=Rhizobium fredii TaxID=380 RepID=A0A2L0HB09_RHIFR|nr:phosphotransferase [Sinorhizobium fredii]AUX78382.1 aminoglycoside phosphotransferase protein [Sinorhizobium fredii]
MADIPEALAGRLSLRAKEALSHWGLSRQQPELLKYRENAVFKVALADGRPAVLRLHRPGYHSAEALVSELQWMNVLEQGGIEVPTPISTLKGDDYTALPASVDFPEQNADIVSWLSGTPLGQSGVPLSHGPEDMVRIFAAVGAKMADLHNISDAWERASALERPSWDKRGLLGDNPLWGRFWDLDALSTRDQDKLCRLRGILLSEMERINAEKLDFGLIHADLVRENVLVTASSVQFIDFDDSGYGWRLFDIATTLLRNRKEPRYREIRQAVLDGYRRNRELSDREESLLPMFMLLRSLTYIGWIGERPEFADNGARLSRYLSDAYGLADEYLGAGW